MLFGGKKFIYSIFIFVSFDTLGSNVDGIVGKINFDWLEMILSSRRGAYAGIGRIDMRCFYFCFISNYFYAPFG